MRLESPADEGEVAETDKETQSCAVLHQVQKRDLQSRARRESFLTQVILPNQTLYTFRSAKKKKLLVLHPSWWINSQYEHREDRWGQGKDSVALRRGTEVKTL